MTFRQIAGYLSISAETLEHGVRVYLWRENENQLPCHRFDTLAAAVDAYGDEELDECGSSVHIDNESVVFWLK
ncbi:MAG: hypothetical protein IIY75_09310 [Erysipelotrichales bacterium]|nr:hypothetical protein [Erysipelotrichales bacterium]